MKFSDFIELHRGYDLPKTKRNADGLVPVIAAGGYDGFHDTAKVQGPGVITGRSGTLGSVYFNTTDFWPLNTTLFVSNFKGNDPLFVYYYLKTMDLGQYATGTTVPTLNRNHLNQIEVNIPDLAQQQEIANKLNLFDKKISTLNDINDNLAAVVEMIFQKMLLTQTAEETIPLSKLFTTKSGYAFKSKDWSDTGSSVVKIKDINGKTIDTGGLSYVENVEALTKASKFHVSGGETVIALTGATTGKIGVVPNKLDAYINQRVGLTTPSNSDIHRSLIWSVFLQSDVINGLIGLADGSAQANLSPTDINNFEIAISTQRISEFQIIADSLFEAYIANLSEISILGNMRNELLTELLS